MDAATPRPQFALTAMPPRKKGPATQLRIDTPAQNSDITLVQCDNSAPASAISPATSDTDSFVFPAPSKPRSRNMKKLSLNLPSAQSSVNSLLSPTTSEQPRLFTDSNPIPPPSAARRRPSVISLPTASTSTLLHRKDEDLDGSPSAPYLDGPIQILPGIWLGSEDNARDWKGLIERGIKSVLNVAKEVTTPFDNGATQPLRPFMSTPDLNATLSGSADPTFYPAHVPSGRPSMHYLKLAWSHGQSDLVKSGFPVAFSFVDHALERGDGVLIHCQCGVSRSATLVIALVMRAAATCSPSVPPEVWALKGMQGAYSFVKEKSKWVGPNMSLIYQLLDYERAFKPASSSPLGSERSSLAAEEEEWGRRRQMLDDAEIEGNGHESIEVMREARALDKAMEDRRVARKSSASSMGSSNGIGMGHAWRNKYGRQRAGSIASIVTTGSILSEHLVEEDEEQELLGIGGGFTEPSCSSAEPTEDEATASTFFGDSTTPSNSLLTGTPKAVRLPPPSAPAHKSSFELPPVPVTAFRSTFDINVTPKAQIKTKVSRRRPKPLVGILPPVPSSPITPINVQDFEPVQIVRPRMEGRKPDLPPSQLRKPSSHRRPSQPLVSSATPSQTLFVFPPSPPHAASSRAPSTMTLTSNASLVPFPALRTPKVSTFKTGDRRRSFIGIGVPVTPTTASSRVDARGWIGL